MGKGSRRKGGGEVSYALRRGCARHGGEGSEVGSEEVVVGRVSGGQVTEVGGGASRAGGGGKTRDGRIVHLADLGV